MAIISEEILALSKEIREENGKREELLKHKCNWEQMTRCKVLREYGDPATWPAFKEEPKAVVQPSCYMFLDRTACISYPQKCISCGHNDLFEGKNEFYDKTL